MDARWLRRLIVTLTLVAWMPAVRADEAADRLRQVVTLARAGSWDEAEAAMPDTAALGRDQLPLLQDVSSTLRAHCPATAARALAAMRRLDPDAVRPRVALETLWGDNPHLDGLYAADLPQYPVDAETLAAGGVTVVTLAVKPFVSLPPVNDPATGAAYPHTVNVYVEKDGRLSLRFLVYAAPKVDVPRARQAGRFLGAMSDLTDRLLGTFNRASYPMPVWLAADGEAGARQWNGAITVQSANTERSDAEWVRELAHEWGHAALPGVDDFSQPEAWANGDLGERLFLPLLSRSGRLDHWSAGLDLTAYLRKSVDPLRDAFMRSGPDAKLLADRGLRGYRHFLGACLYINEAYGLPALLDALDAAGGGSPRDFMAAFQSAQAAKARLTVSHVGAPGPRPVFIPRAGRYSLDGRGVRRNGRPLTGAGVFQTGWTMLDWNGVLSLRRSAASGNTTTRKG